AHYHADSAFVTGYVLSGSIRSEVNDGKTQVFHAGEHWTEQPGAYHPISENASATEPASLLAIFVVDTTDADAWSRTSDNENPLERRRGVHYRERTPRAELKPSLSPYLLTRAQIEARLISESMNKGRSSVVHTHYKAT